MYLRLSRLIQTVADNADRRLKGDAMARPSNAGSPGSFFTNWMGLVRLIADGSCLMCFICSVSKPITIKTLLMSNGGRILLKYISCWTDCRKRTVSISHQLCLQFEIPWLIVKHLCDCSEESLEAMCDGVFTRRSYGQFYHKETVSSWSLEAEDASC